MNLMDEKNRLLGRLTDKYIQDLFTNPPYTPVMPYVGLDGKELGATDDELIDRIENRLKNEHRSTSYVVLKDVRFEPLEEGTFFSGSQRRSVNVIWIKEAWIQKARENALKLFMDSYSNGDDPNMAFYDISHRGKGFSTRLADSHIQEFLSLEPGENVEIRDHYKEGTEGMANDRLLKTICGRLEKEYKVKFYAHKGAIPKLVKVES
jgi:hypothetical protein